MEDDAANTGAGEEGRPLSELGPLAAEDCSLLGLFGRLGGGGLRLKTLGLGIFGPVEVVNGGRGCPARKGERAVELVGEPRGGSLTPLP